MSMMQLGEHLHKIGLNVFPVIIENKKKLPYLSLGTGNPYAWKHLKENRLDLSRFKEAFTNAINEKEEIFLGVLPGKIKDGKYKGSYFWSIDFDDNENIEILDITPEKCKENKVWIEKSLSKGYHLYGITKTPREYEKCHEINIELFSDDKFFIAIYNNFEHDLYDLKPMNLPEVWDGWKQKISKHKGIELKEKPHGSMKDLKKGVSKGSRNTSAFKLACQSKDMGWDIGLSTELIMTWNRKNKPPLHDSELVNIIKSAYSRPVKYKQNENVVIIDEEKQDKNLSSDSLSNFDFEEAEKKILNERSFIGYYTRYIKKRTNADPKYAIHMAFQLLGISVGVNTVHNIQPKPIHHNTYIALIGTSTIARKTTVQELSMALVNQEMHLPTDFSPEGFLQALGETPQGVAPLGEFSSFLRSMKHGGYMSKFKELQNELHGCPPVFHRRLANKTKSVTVMEPYVNLNTTCTPEEFFPNLDDNLIYGGTLPRWIVVDGKAKYKPRSKLSPDVANEEHLIRKVLRNVEKLFIFNEPIENSPVIPWVEFEFTDGGLEEFNKIDRELMHNKRWRDIQPFVGRYLNYLIAYADLLFLSDLIGIIGLEEFSNVMQLHDIEYDVKNNLNNFNNLNNLNNFNNLTYIESITSVSSSIDSPVKKDASEVSYVGEVVKLFKLFKKPAFQQKRNNFTFYISKSYVQRAFEILMPSLNFAKQVTKYVNEDMKIAKLKTVLEKHSPLDRSNAMRYSKLMKKDFDDSIDTLIEREEVFCFTLEHLTAQFRPKRMYCIVDNKKSKKCKNCKYKGCSGGEL